MSVELAEIPGRFAQPDPSTISKLPKPTKRENQKGKCDECGGWHGLPAVHLDYMGHADVTLALIEVDPLWTWEPVAIDQTSGGPAISNQNGRLVMWGWLIVQGVRRLCVGTCDASKGDPEKELIGDLLRNGAMRFGIGTRLWSKADSADPAGSGKAGGYERKQKADDKPHPNSDRVTEALAALKQLDTSGKSAFKEWNADGRSISGAALLADDAWLGYVEDWLAEHEQRPLAGVS